MIDKDIEKFEAPLFSYKFTESEVKECKDGNDIQKLLIDKLRMNVVITGINKGSGATIDGPIIEVFYEVPIHAKF
jgi:hypothetical protein